MTQEMNEKIASGLRRIEQVHGVRVLYACESGSRAWGFESPDSDYDVRFIYVRSTSEYLTVFDDVRDVIDVNDLVSTDLADLASGELDFSGWDLRKTLLMAYKSNPSLHEWLNSPVVYLGHPDESSSVAAIKAAAVSMWTPDSSWHHYRSMAKRTYMEHIYNRPEVTYKRYLYVIRPLLCARYVSMHGAIPPVPFNDLLESQGGDLPAQEILHLLKMKAANVESAKQPSIPALDDWIDTELAKPAPIWRGRLEMSSLSKREELDAVFRSLL